MYRRAFQLSLHALQVSSLLLLRTWRPPATAAAATSATTATATKPAAAAELAAWIRGRLRGPTGWVRAEKVEVEIGARAWSSGME